MGYFRLDSDERLKTKFSKSVGEISSVNLCRLLSENTKVGIRVKDPELRLMRFTLGVKNKSAADCMDAASSIGSYRWENIGKKGYLFLTNAKQLSIFGSLSDSRLAAADEGMLNLIDNLDKLPPDIRDGLRAGRKVNLANLDNDSLNKVKNYFIETKRVRSGTTGDDFMDDKVRSAPSNKFALQINKSNRVDGLTLYNMLVVTPGGGTLSELSDYERRYGVYQKKGQLGGADRQIWMPDVEPEKIAAAQRHPALNDRVTIDLPKATLVDCMRVLYDRYDLSVVGLSSYFFTRHRPVALRSVPLRYALDTLVKAYSELEGIELEWQRRPSGFLSIRRKDRGFATERKQNR